MKFMNKLNIGFIGFGLIGGSIAKAVKAVHPEYIITVTSRTLAPLELAKKEKIVDIIAPEPDSNFSDCDMIFLCTPVITITKYLKVLKKIKKPSCIITDVGSVKGYIHEAVNELGMQDCFIGGHPMAGSEKTGYKNSSKEILVNAKYVITPSENVKPEQIELYKSLIEEMKAIPVIMDYNLHDYTVAGISHLPHLASACLARLVMEADDKETHMHLLASTGFKDTTRIAASSPEMWEQICATNTQPITELLGKYIDLLTSVKTSLENNSPDAVRKLFSETKEYRETF